jgi:diguanylate cyclase (GGDEF)-like protein
MSFNADRRLVPLFVLAAVGSALTLLAVILQLSARQNEIAASERLARAEGALRHVSAHVEGAVLDNAVWNEAYRRVGASLDPGWFHENLGAAQHGVMFHEGAFLFDADGRPLQAAWAGEAIDDFATPALSPALDMALTSARAEPGQAFGGFFAWHGRPTYLAVSAICEHTGAKRCSQRYLAFAVYAEREIAEVAALANWHDLRIAAEGPEGASLPIRDAAGQELAWLVWDNPTPGYAAVSGSAPFVLAGLFASAVSVAGLFHRVRRTTDTLLAATREAQRLASTDALTGVANRRALSADVERRLAARESFCLMILDFDGFKEVNDTLGHELGDALLLEMTRRMRTLEPVGGLVARLGGDEFALVVPGGTLGACELGRDVVMTIRQPFDVPGQRIAISASVGVAEAAPGMWADELFRRADVAMYDAKSERAGAVRIYARPMDEKTRLFRALDGEMRAALDDGQFRVVYQPILRVSDGRVAAVEALLRWEHPTRGLVSPADFIPAAEQSRFIVELGAFALREACARLAARPDLHLSVNLSPVQLLDDRLTERVRAALEETRFDPARLELEVTEGYLISQEERALATLTRLRDELGVRVSLDDFGSGYASLGYLRRYPLDKVKIDKSFVDPIDTDPRARQVLLSILELCRAFEIPITVEGVETTMQAEFLAAAGCDFLQGYLLGAPRMDPPALDAFMVRGAA